MTTDRDRNGDAFRIKNSWSLSEPVAIQNSMVREVVHQDNRAFDIYQKFHCYCPSGIVDVLWIDVNGFRLAEFESRMCPSCPYCLRDEAEHKETIIYSLVFLSLKLLF